MLLVTFVSDGHTRIGALDRKCDEVTDFSAPGFQLPGSMIELIKLGDTGLAAAQEAVASKQGRIPMSAVKLLAPIPRPPRNIFCLGKNYYEHALEVQSLASGHSEREAIPKRPIVFTKATSSVTGSGDPIPRRLDPTHSVDYEGELAVIIGNGGLGIHRGAAMKHVYGYTIINDVTSRRMQRGHHQWFMGKSLDGFCPMGPAIATADEVPDVAALRLQTWVNGELRQDGAVADLIFDIPTVIETLSTTMTLERGDIIATGTPAGVGMGFEPPKFLRPGDVVRVTIEPIGTLENPVN